MEIEIKNNNIKEVYTTSCKCDPIFTVNGKCPYCGFNYTENQ